VTTSRDRLTLHAPGFGSFTSFGSLALPSELNRLAALNSTATYSGQIVGVVNNGGTQGFATGSYSNTWRFGPRNGIATITFDNTTYGGGSTPNTFQVGCSPLFTSTTPLSSTSGRTAEVIGVFQSNNQSASTQAGAVIVNGTNYKGVGLFSANR